MLRTSLISAGVTLSLAFHAFAQTTEYYVVQNTATKKCTLVDRRPTTQTTVVAGDGVFITRTEAEAGLKKIKVCTANQNLEATSGGAGHAALRLSFRSAGATATGRCAMSEVPTDIQMDKPFCPQCGLPMQLSHLEPTMQAEDHVIWRCTCGETLEKVSLRERSNVQ